MSRQLFGLREYARYRESNGLPGATLTAVQKAIASNRITVIIDEKGKQKIDPEVADFQWGKNTDPDQSARANSGKEILPPSSGEKPSGGRGDDGGRYWEAKTSREEVELARARLALEKDAGQLVDRDGARRAAYESGRMLRDMVLSVPSKVAAEVAAMTDARAIETRIREELRTVLAELSRLAAVGFEGQGDE